MDPPRTALDLLERATHQHTGRGIVAYPADDTLQGRSVRYGSLKQICQGQAAALRAVPGYREGDVVLIHMTDHLDNMLWFWTVLLAGCVPALSTPLPNDQEQRARHLTHLHKLFDNPIVVTRQAHAEMLDVGVPLNTHPVESMTRTAPPSAMEAHTPPPEVHPDDLAALMLTSGSTGNAKAVRLTHGQIVASVTGKTAVVELSADHSIMNWVGIDHVGALLECHLLALYQGLEQVHVQPTSVISNPLLFLELITRHHVGRTFAPNFFLANLLKAAERNPSALYGIDLRCLRFLTSGGEANPVTTAAAVTRLLTSLGAPEPVLAPAFGMTETCAGSIYNTESPAFDLQSGMEFASLGRCVPGIEMRVVPRDGSTDPSRGSLQVRGPIVTTGYYKNPEATAAAFVDGWFDTGDEALIDATGHLHMTGRIKEHVRINGIALIPSDIESGLNAACIPGAAESYFACFGFRPDGAETERLAVLYLPRYEPGDTAARVATNAAIVQSVIYHSGVCPYVLPLDATILEKSTLGKLSRGKLKTAFAEGKFAAYQATNDDAMRAAAAVGGMPQSRTELQLLTLFRQVLGEELGIPEDTLGIETPLFEIGVTSVHLILLKRRIEAELGITDLPMLVLLSNATARSVATAIDERRERTEAAARGETNTAYAPVVTLRSGGSKTPLWLIHPGVGEVLVFLGLAKYLEDRPVYALRARGFEEGETFFANINEAVSTYHAAIKAVQPHGPYALAGYSYGTMLAFETAKRLEADGANSVRFVGSFNLPPHIKMRMEQLDFTECALHLAFFLDLLSEAQAREMSPLLQGASRDAIMDAIFARAPPERLAELNLPVASFAHWAELSHSMQAMARTYEPSGTVPAIDAFYCDPLAVVASDKKDWLERHMSKWSDFCSGDVRFHEVQGEHYTMINATHVPSFQLILRDALTARGL